MWAEYLSGTYGDKEPEFSIKFNKPLGAISDKDCYTVHYLGNGRWSAVGIDRSTGEGNHRYSKGGLPKDYLINIWGRVFTFNEGGEVYLAETNELLGSLHCHIGSECNK
jgi:hypothetical protein